MAKPKSKRLLKCPYRLLASDLKTKDWHTGRTLVQKQIWMGLVVGKVSGFSKNMMSNKELKNQE